MSCSTALRNDPRVLALLLGLCLIGCGGSNLASPDPKPALVAEDWNVASIDSHVRSLEDGHRTLVADTRGDGVSRVYNSDGGIVEYTYRNGWLKSRVTSEIVGNFVAGPLRDDGKPRIYAVTTRQTLVEFEWDGGRWTSTPIPLGVNILPYMTAVTGDPRNEGRPSLYFIAERALHELRYDSGRWTKAVIDPAASLVEFAPSTTGLTAGPARRDGQEHLYLVSVSSPTDSQLVEYIHSGDAWIKETVMAFGPGEPRPTPFGFAKDANGQTTLILLGDGGSLWEVAYDGRVWQKRLDKDLLRYGGSCTAGSPRTDRVFRIYCAGAFGRMEELSRASTAWTRSAEWQVGDVALTSIAVGDGRSDGVPRLYTQAFFVYSAEPLHEWTALR
jgi:hypothetical protein